MITEAAYWNLVYATEILGGAIMVTMLLVPEIFITAAKTVVLIIRTLIGS